MIPPRFIVDTNVGHLARKLRMMGYDTLFINPIDDARLIRIAREEDRVIISSDGRLFDRRPLRLGAVRAFLVKVHDPPNRQLRQIIRAFDLDPAVPLNRCLLCNTPLVRRHPAEAEGRVPPHVYDTVERYDYCPACDQFFWEGDHVKRMRESIRRL